MIKEILNNDQKKIISRIILENLTDYFANDQAREGHINDSEDKIFLCAYIEEKPTGFLYLKETGKDTAEIAVMGVLPCHHRKGIGSKLLDSAKAICKEKGYCFIQVKTVEMGKYEEYDRTNRFYLAQGFKEFEVMPTFWDEANPCQIYIMSL